MSTRSLVLLLAALVSCRRPSPDGSASDRAPASASAAPATPLAPLPSARPLVVWGRSSGSSLHSSFVLAPDGAVGETLPGIRLPVSGQRAVLTLTTDERPLPPCPAGSVPFAHAVRHDLSLAVGDERRPLSLPGDGASERQLLVLGSLDDRVFVRVAELLDPCSDPPRYRVSVVDLSLVYGTSTVLASDDTPGAPAAQREVDRVRASLAVALAAVPRGGLPAGVVIEGGGEASR